MDAHHGEGENEKTKYQQNLLHTWWSKQAVETDRACYMYKSVTIKEMWQWRILTNHYVSVWPALLCCNRLAWHGVWMWNLGLVVVLQSGRGLMILNFSGRDWGNKSWAVAVRKMELWSWLGGETIVMSVVVRRHWRPVWIRVSARQRQTQTALRILIYPENQL